MPVRVYHNGRACTIRPTPLVSISENLLKDGAGQPIGVTYSIVLTGTLIADQGTPYAANPQNGQRYPFIDASTPNTCGPYDAFDDNISNSESNRPPQQLLSTVYDATNSIFFKQKVLRALFSKEGQRLEISDCNDDEPTIVCYPRLAGDISFEEGIYMDICRFTINLEADLLLDKDQKVSAEGTLVHTNSGVLYRENLTESELNNNGAAYIVDYSDEWSLETDDSVGESINLPRSYRISHSLSATGKSHYTENGLMEPAWIQAKKFVQRRLASSINNYPNILGQIGSGTVNLVSSYGGFNHIRTEQVNEGAGTYSVSENWVLASGTSYENYNMSVSAGVDSAYVNVSIDGNIKGLSSISPSGFGSISGTAYNNAIAKYYNISNSGAFGVGCDIYKRANNVVAVQLNSQPKSVSLGLNEYTGEITYNLQFDNRPMNIISGVLAETIQINDTYPGDVFAVIPVIGRKTGPVLQYIGGRTEYRRDLQIGLLIDYTKVPYGQVRNSLMLQKPSVVEPTASQLSALINEFSPAKEPGVRKYFIAPPQESWNPKTGDYNISISWTYELDK